MKIGLNLYIRVENHLSHYIGPCQNADDKKNFSEELYIINEIDKELKSSLQYADDAQFNENFLKLRNQARSFVQLKKDINSLTNSGVNVYSVTGDDKVKVEKNIVNMQSYYVDIIKSMLVELDNKSDLKETGDGKFEIISNIGKVTLTVDKFTNIFSMLKLSQEMDYSITIGLDIKKDAKLNIPFDIIGTANFKINFKKIGDDIYLTLSDYLIKFDGISAMTKTYEDMLIPYKGKTIHLSTKNTLGQDIKLDPNAQLENFKNVLDILSKESILTPLKKKGEGFILIPKSETLTKIGVIYGEKYDKYSVINSRKSLNSMPLLYTETAGNPKISSEIIDKGSEVKLNIEKKGTEYGIEYSFKGTKNGEAGEIYIYLQKALYKLNITSPEAIIKFSLENKIFDLLLIANKQEYVIKGTSDDNITDLKILFNTKELGKIQATKDGKGNYTYNFGLKITDFSQFGVDIPAELKGQTLEINLVGKYLLERGEFKIDKPTSFIEIEEAAKLNPGFISQSASARDSKRKSDLSSLSSKINVITAQTGKLPKSLNDLGVNLKDFTDPSDGEIIGGQKCGYVYEIKGDKFRLTTCQETGDSNIYYVGNY